jgi:thiamine biosynthesis protein ThiI
MIDIPTAQGDECVRRLNYIPGVASFSVGMPMPPDFDKVAELGVQWIEPVLLTRKTLSFCVRTQRSDKNFPCTSPEFSYQVGSRIVQQLHEKGLTVDLKNAEFVLEIEIGYGETIVFQSRVPGLRGLPVGTAGDVLTLLSGGIDSPVAAYMAVRRGCRSHFIFFDNRGFLGRGGYDKVLRLANLVNRYQGRGRLYVAPFGDIQLAIRDHCRPANRIVLYRRMMYRIAQAVAVKTGCLALVTGESIGQVASQTLENLSAVSNVVSMSVFRPVIALDKVDIIALARKIETFDISIESSPDCCSVFMPPSPVTKSKIRDLEYDEQSYPWQTLMQQTIENLEIVELDA